MIGHINAVAVCPLDFAGEASRKEVKPMDIIIGLAACCTIAMFVIQTIHLRLQNHTEQQNDEKQ